jgi:acyl carrier protein
MAEDALLTLIAGTLGVPPSEINEASAMSNTRKWDSLRQLMLITELETVYGIELTDQEMLETTSVQQIRTVLAVHGVA